MNRYMLERQSFEAAHPRAEILKTADLIAENLWFSWRHCFKRIKALPKAARKDAVRLLRVAQKQRRHCMDADQKWLYDRLESQIDYMQSFTAPLTPSAYALRLQPIMLNGERIGLTLGGKRQKGGRVTVFYKSKVNNALEVEKIETVQAPTDSEYLNAHGAMVRRSVFHVRLKT